MRYGYVIIALLLWAIPSLGEEEWTPDSGSVGQIGISIDGLAFFRDNEYDTYAVDGYTLPGAWVRPAVTYNPLADIHLELGASGLFFDGANRYPCYVYHDIGKWKGNQYQSGAHLLPWVRAQVSFGNTTFVLGDIYGADTHQFITPLYNREQLLSADPEAGFQILSKGRVGRLDAYVNWQSYQFQEDTHQESFTVGVNGQLNIRPLGAETNASLIINHRGGEQDQPELHLGVQTLVNASLGIKKDNILPLLGGAFADMRNVEVGAQASVLACYQQSGSLWDFDGGTAVHAAFTADIFHDVHVELGHLYSFGKFISLYGNPFFSTYSTKHEEHYLKHASTTYLQLDYSHTWADAYTFGAGTELYHTPRDFSFAFGVFFRFHPQFTLFRK